MTCSISLAGFRASQPTACVQVSGNHQDSQIGVFQVLGLQKVESIRFGHIQIQDQQVWHALLYEDKSLLA
jgi:hypothetical protein